MNVQKSLYQTLADGEKKQYLRFVEDAAERALKEVGLDKNGVIHALIRELSVSNQFADEGMEEYDYPPGYQPKGVAEQISRLKELFPELGTANVELANRELLPNAEGRFAIPRWDKIGRTYNEAVEKVLALISKTRDGKFHNWREGNLGPNRLREHDRTVAMWKKLCDAQSGHDILIVPAQFGLRYRGRSIRRAREVMKGGEFGLGAFAVGIMLLSHPERIQHCPDLCIDCAGDEYDYPGDEDRFSRAPIFGLRDNRFEFGAGWFDSASNLYGSASGFLSR